MSRIKIRLFGTFRKWSESGEVELDIPLQATVSDLKSVIEQELKKNPRTSDLSDIVFRSVLADEHRILKDSEGIEDSVTLSILPPVCGG